MGYCIFKFLRRTLSFLNVDEARVVSGAKVASKRVWGEIGDVKGWGRWPSEASVALGGGLPLSLENTSRNPKGVDLSRYVPVANLEKAVGRDHGLKLESAHLGLNREGSGVRLFHAAFLAKDMSLDWS